METTIEIQVHEGRNIVDFENENYYVDGVVVVELDHTEIYPETRENPAEYRTEENVREEWVEVVDKQTGHAVDDVGIKWVVV